jgi:Na+/proline symporter
MKSAWLLAAVLAYFALLWAVAWRTSHRADEQSFFVGNRRSAWPLVAFGMVGTSLSGVTFVSVPGAVGANGFTYLQLVLGHVLGYAVVALVLLPLYHRLQLVSIYGLLRERLGDAAQRTGAGIFIAARTLGATARLYLVIQILQLTLLDAMGLPFWLTSAVMVLMILAYTVQGGVRTIVWTDTLQTAAMLLGLVLCAALLLQRLDLSATQALAQMQERGLARLWGTDPNARDYFAKQIVAGLFITVAMTGMDQEMMQKSLSIRTLRDAQKNLLVLSMVLLAVVSLFVFLGGLLHLAAPVLGVVEQGDKLFAAVVMQHLPGWVQVIFILALISALFPSADGALTALTASTCIDLVRLPERAGLSQAKQRRVRQAVHLGFAVLFFALVLVFQALNDPSMINLILRLASYTYGPLLGLFAFAIFTRRTLRSAWVPVVALAAPALCWWFDAHQTELLGRWLGGWQIGLELLVLNGALTFAGLWLVSRAKH